MSAKANSRMKRNQQGGCGWRRQRLFRAERHEASEELKFGKTTKVMGIKDEARLCRAV